MRKLKEAKSIKEKDTVIMDFERIVDISIHNPFFEEIIMRNKEDYRILRDLPHILERSLRRIINNNTTKE